MQITRKAYLNTTVSGRSLLEMLGVIAVMGVLTVAGLKGFQYAMNRIEVNKYINAILNAYTKTMHLRKLENEVTNLRIKAPNNQNLEYYGSAGSVFIKVPEVEKDICKLLFDIDITGKQGIVNAQGAELTINDCANKTDLYFKFSMHAAVEGQPGAGGDPDDSVGGEAANECAQIPSCGLNECCRYSNEKNACGHYNVETGLLQTRYYLNDEGCITSRQVCEFDRFYDSETTNESDLTETCAGRCENEACNLCYGVTCNNHGQCNANNGKCECEPAYSGTNCETFDACYGNTCNNHGKCSNGVCVCDEGWIGSDCGTPDPCVNVDCNGQGSCSNNNGVAVCTCNPGWSGDNCETDLCNGNGTYSNGACVCDPGWAGTYCTEDRGNCGKYSKYIYLNCSGKSDAATVKETLGIDYLPEELICQNITEKMTCDETCMDTCTSEIGGPIYSVTNSELNLTLNFLAEGTYTYGDYTFTTTDTICCYGGSTGYTITAGEVDCSGTTFPMSWCSWAGRCCCLAEGTCITLADGSTKKVEDICYEDELLVWDFDNGCYAKANPLYIKVAEVRDEYNLINFDDGTELKTILDHRIFNKELGKFTYPILGDETPLGTTTVTADGREIKLVSREVVHEKVRYFNIITDYHMNCFANGILTSCRLNNLYPIKNMKFVKDDRVLVPYSEFKALPKKWYDGLRLAEQPREINRAYDYVHTNTLTEYVLSIMALDKSTNELKKAV